MGVTEEQATEMAKNLEFKGPAVQEVNAHLYSALPFAGETLADKLYIDLYTSQTFCAHNVTLSGVVVQTYTSLMLVCKYFEHPPFHFII